MCRDDVAWAIETSCIGSPARVHRCVCRLGRTDRATIDGHRRRTAEFRSRQPTAEVHLPTAVPLTTDTSCKTEGLWPQAPSTAETAQTPQGGSPGVSGPGCPLCSVACSVPGALCSVSCSELPLWVLDKFNTASSFAVPLEPAQCAFVGLGFNKQVFFYANMAFPAVGFLVGAFFVYLDKYAGCGEVRFLNFNRTNGWTHAVDLKGLRPISPVGPTGARGAVRDKMRFFIIEIIPLRYGRCCCKGN